MKFKICTNKILNKTSDLTDKLNKAMGDTDSETVIAKYYKAMMKFPFYLHGLPPTDHFSI